jgi:hypothetical protein
MNTIYSPYHLAYNTYSDLMVDALKKQGIRVEKLSYALKRPWYLLSTKIIILINEINCQIYAACFIS